MTLSTSSTASLFSQLQDLRLSQSHHPHLVTRIGQLLEQRQQLAKLSKQDVSDAVEQIVVAALETAHYDLAQTLIARLSAHFRHQPHGLHRITYLQGMLLEAKGALVQAKELYEQRLRDDDTDVAVRKRLAALHLSSPIIDLPTSSSSSSSTKTLPLTATQTAYASASLSRTQGISHLLTYLDTYYLDLSSWLTLSSSYCSLAQYAAALTCINHAIVLAPHDPFVALKGAEISYTMGEYGEAWKGFCRVVEMSTEQGDEEVVLKGAARRAAMGAKLCIPHLRSTTQTNPSTADPLLAPQHLEKMDLLLTRLLLDACSTSSRSGTHTAAAAEWKGGVQEMRVWLNAGEGEGAK
ncbi:hypothetical protein JCM10908_000626 [Rhodotorula pacifica]|uniref:uncharacterized protein n=1 Tax=Rhodotorula pacifica TaxID=1495444 RepID=UPI00317E6618